MPRIQKTPPRFDHKTVVAVISFGGLLALQQIYISLPRPIKGMGLRADKRVACAYRGFLHTGQRRRHSVSAPATNMALYPVDDHFQRNLIAPALQNNQICIFLAGLYIAFMHGFYSF